MCLAPLLSTTVQPCPRSLPKLAVSAPKGSEQRPLTLTKALSQG